MLTSFGYTWSTMYHVNTAGNAARPRHRHHDLPPGRSPVRRRRPRDLDAVELQGHRPLRDAVRHRPLGIVEGAERLQLRPHDQRDAAGRRRAHGARRADHRQPLSDRRRSSTCAPTSRSTFGAFGKATLQLDVFNLTNAGTVTTVRVTNTATAPFNEVTAILNPRVVRAGITLRVLDDGFPVRRSIRLGPARRRPHLFIPPIIPGRKRPVSDDFARPTSARRLHSHPCGSYHPSGDPCACPRLVTSAIVLLSFALTHLSWLEDE